MARSVWSDASLWSDMWPYATPPEEESAETEEAAPTLDGDAAAEDHGSIGKGTYRYQGLRRAYRGCAVT